VGFRAHAARLWFLGALTLTARARAGNDDESFVGNQAAMTGGAVFATVSDASATWYNPAGLANVEQTHVDVSGTAYTLRFYSTPDLIRARSGEAVNLRVTEFVSIPSQLAYARRIGVITLGVGYFVPQSSNLLLRKSLRVTSGDAVSAWQLAVEVTRISHSFGAALGWQLARHVRLGFGLIATYEVQSFASSIIASERDGPEQASFALSSQIGNSARLGVEPSVGFQFELSRRVTLALSARGPRSLITQSTQQSIAEGAGQSGVLGAELAEPREAKSGLHLLRAGRVGAGVAYRLLGDAWLAFEADVQPATHSDQSGVQRRAVWNARLGGVYRYSDYLSFGAGLFTDRSPDVESKDAINGSGHFYGGTLGMKLDHRLRLHATEPSSALVLSTTFALKYAYSNGHFNGLVVDPQAVAELSTARRSLVAHETSLYVGGGVSF